MDSITETPKKQRASRRKGKKTRQEKGAVLQLWERGDVGRKKSPGTREAYREGPAGCL